MNNIIRANGPLCINRVDAYQPGNYRFKILLAMKLIAILLTAFCLQVSANSYSQRITIIEKNAPLEKIMRSIRQQSGYSFIFDVKQLKEAKPVSVTLQAQELEEALQVVFKNQPFNYRVKDKVIIISPKATNNTNIAVQQTISGTVTDDGGLPLPGVSVSLKGTTSGTTTDNLGNYALSTSSSTGTLVFSFLGFTTQEVSINNRTTINIRLEESSQSLESVVVIGYQTIKKKDLTGAATLINTENTERIVARSVPEALQGLSPGVSVRNGGRPGQEAVVNIRGLSTIQGNASPLYIIDGMYADPNTTINPNDVETIQVLKDASAAAIYGSRAAAGVIIITTKKGRKGEPKIEASSRVSVATIPKRYDMMNAQEYVITNTNAYQAAGVPLQPSVAGYDGSVNTNWADELLRTGLVQDYNASISGGSDNSNYLISAGYFDDKGVLLARQFDRKSLRINTETRRGRFKLGENLTITSSNNQTPAEGGNFAGNPFYDMFSMVPIIPIRSDALVSTGNPGGWGYGSTGTVNTFSRNQIAVADITNTRTNFTKLLGNAFLDFEILKGLNYRFNAGLETSFDNAKTIRKVGSWYQGQSPDQSRISDNRSQFLSYLFEHTVNFEKTFGKHNINGVFGYTEQTTQRDNTAASKIDMVNYGGDYFTTLTSATGGMTAAGELYRNILNSYLGRLNYNYDDRYLASLTFRSDKDSRFSPEYRTGNFPSIALAWRLSNESFFDVNWISDLKIRGSFGILGSATLDPYQFTGFLNQAPSAVFGTGQTTVNGAIQARLVPNDIRWEEKKTTNLGIDASFLENRLSMTLDLFRSVSTDVVLGRPVGFFTGNLLGNPVTNIGSIENKGIELEMQYRPQASGEFKWNVAANVSLIRNKVLKLGNLGVDEETGLPRTYITSGNTRTQVGRAIGEYYVLKTDGIFQNQAEIDAHRAQAAYAKPGDIRYINFVNGGTNDDINEFDRVYAGSPWPKLTAGMQFNSTYKNFNLSFQLYGAFGQKLYNDVIRDLDSYGYANYRRDINPWTPTNTNTDFPRLGVNYAINGVVDRGITSNSRGNTNRWIEDGSFLRLRNIELGYTIPADAFGKTGLSNIRLFVNAQNLFTITGYSGLDPDVVGANANLEPGVDNGNYPSSRIISFGLNFGF
jgi:TonB-linked SusC/RagA family outer membrane protein